MIEKSHHQPNAHVRLARQHPRKEVGLVREHLEGSSRSDLEMLGLREVGSGRQFWVASGI